jgi:hypothetical protein
MGYSGRYVLKKPTHVRALKGLNQAIQQDAIEAAIGERDTISVVLVEGGHGRPPGVSNPAG